MFAAAVTSDLGRLCGYVVSANPSVNNLSQILGLSSEGNKMLLLKVHDSCYSVLKGHIL